MKLRSLSKRKDAWEFQLKSEDHTLANLIKELSWKNGGEAAYREDHPLKGMPIVKVSASNPKKVLKKVSSDIVKLSSELEKAFE